MGFFMYLSTHFVTLWRRKQFFIDFKKSLDDIDEHIRKCDKVATRRELKKGTNYMYYATWFVVLTCFVATTGYDVYVLLQ